MGTELTTSVPVAADITEDLQLVAEDVGTMQIAQQQLGVWFDEKKSLIDREIRDVALMTEAAMKNGFASDGYARQLNRLDKRAEFYAKCAAAVRAGYCIVPNMPGTTFAIRTRRRLPLKKESTSSWGSSHRQSSESPDIGDGDWKNPLPIRMKRTVPISDGKGGTKELTTYFAGEFCEEIEFPISIARPAVMTAAGKAMAGKFFDELDVVDNQQRGDPLLLGVIRDTVRKKEVSFLIAWYIDTATL